VINNYFVHDTIQIKYDIEVAQIAHN